VLIIFNFIIWFFIIMPIYKWNWITTRLKDRTCGTVIYLLNWPGTAAVASFPPVHLCVLGASVVLRLPCPSGGGHARPASGILMPLERAAGNGMCQLTMSLPKKKRKKEIERKEGKQGKLERQSAHVKHWRVHPKDSGHRPGSIF